MAQSNISGQFNQMANSVLQLSLLKDIAAKYNTQEASKAQEQVLKQRQAKLAKTKYLAQMSKLKTIRKKENLKQTLNQMKFDKEVGELNGSN